MQELAPVVLFVALFLVLIVASLLTLVGSLLVIWRYQRGVEAAMHESGVAAAPVAAARAEAVGAVPSAASGEARSAATTSAVPTRTDADAVFARALRAPREAARSAAAFGLAFAVVLALAFLRQIRSSRSQKKRQSVGISIALTVLTYLPGNRSFETLPTAFSDLGPRALSRLILRQSARSGWIGSSNGINTTSCHLMY